MAKFSLGILKIASRVDHINIEAEVGDAEVIRTGRCIEVGMHLMAELSLRSSEVLVSGQDV